jgi:ribose transport system substrate-binding protein
MRTRAIAVLAGALVLAQLGARAQEPAAPALRIAFIGKSYANPVFLAAHRGAEDAARELSSKHGFPIEVSIMTPPGEDAAVQAQRVALAVQQGVQAIAISASEAAALTKAINEAVAKGIAVMTFDVDLPESKRFAHYGVDDAKAGEMVLEELAGQLGGTGKVAILAGNPDAPNIKKRTAGVKKAAARHSGIKIVGEIHHLERPYDAAEEVLRVDAATPDLKGWAMVGGWPLFQSTLSASLLDDLQSRKLKVVAVDALPEELPYVDKGIAVLLAQPVYQWGAVCVRTIVDKVHFKKDVSGTIPMELVRVSRESLGAWTRQLRDWGFSPLPEEYLKLP